MDDRSSSLNPLSFTSPSKTRSVRAVRLVHPSCCVPFDSLHSGFSSELPLMWFSKERPSADTCYPRPVPTSPRGCLRSSVAKHSTSSAHVVPPDFDGLLRELLCRFVAPCSQPWGSSRFRRGLPPAVSPQLSVFHAFPWLAPHTLQSFPLPGSRIASPRPLPSRRRSAHRFRLAALDLMALLLQEIRCWSTRFPACTSPILPWALFPFKALPSIPLPIGQPRSITALAALLWATSTEVAAP